MANGVHPDQMQYWFDYVPLSHQSEKIIQGDGVGVGNVYSKFVANN